jgi:lytic cellulose monooxygenase (C1-hydroxylating)
MAYMSKVPDASTADGSAGWFKVYQNGWAAAGGGSADSDRWGVKEMNACCGKVDVKIPEDILPGDYLLRGEVIALHSQPAQLYMSCYQLTVEGNGTATPATVKFPGAYGQRDPGLTFNLHAKAATYVVPGPTVVAGGVEKTPGASCSGGCQATCAAGKGAVGTALMVAAPVETGAATAGCTSVKKVQAWQQCGGAGFAGDGCTECPVCRDLTLAGRTRMSCLTDLNAERLHMQAAERPLCAVRTRFIRGGWRRSTPGCQLSVNLYLAETDAERHEQILFLIKDCQDEDCTE